MCDNSADFWDKVICSTQKFKVLHMVLTDNIICMHIPFPLHWLVPVTSTTVPCHTLLLVVVDTVMTGSTKSHQTVELD